MDNTNDFSYFHLSITFNPYFNQNFNISVNLERPRSVAQSDCTNSRVYKATLLVGGFLYYQCRWSYMGNMSGCSGTDNFGLILPPTHKAYPFHMLRPIHAFFEKPKANCLGQLIHTAHLFVLLAYGLSGVDCWINLLAFSTGTICLNQTFSLVFWNSSHSG